ncbi:hypothetical protein GCM10010293_42160 [Streptomyces griseoflavus]|nr:hypothetical protein GCM10010293_42160 [Streptomyces griseoflavus]
MRGPACGAEPVTGAALGVGHLPHGAPSPFADPWHGNRLVRVPGAEAVAIGTARTVPAEGAVCAFRCARDRTEATCLDRLRGPASFGSSPAPSPPGCTRLFVAPDDGLIT